MKKSISILFLALFLIFPGTSFARNSPRDYLPLDPGTFFLALYYDHQFGNDYYKDGQKKNRTTNYTGNVSIIRPVYFTQIGPFTIDPQLILPVGELALKNDQSSGIGDATLAATIWFINNKEGKFYLGYSPFFTIPTGQYDRDNSINLGANRWATKQEVCIAKGFGDRTWLEVAVNAQFYSDNTNAAGLDNRKVTSSKDPGFGAETHLSYNLTKDLFGSLDYYYAGGGETTLDSVRQEDWASTHTAGITFAYMLNPTTQLMSHFDSDIAVANGIRTSTFGLRLGFIF
jgi:hypothetical protein